MKDPDHARLLRAAIVATSILAFSSPSLAASDAELSQLGDKMSGAFRCSTYAGMFHDWKEARRLFQIGLKAGRDLVEGMKSRDDPGMRENSAIYLLGAPTDFVVGQMYDSASEKAYDEIVKYQNGLPREPSRWLDPPEAKTQAEFSYRKSNCSLIN